MRAHYRAQRDGAERVENLDELVNAAKVFELEEDLAGVPCGVAREPVSGTENIDGTEIIPMSPLDSFLSHAALESGDTQAQAGEQAVQLMTVHAAKGLEFDAVFISGLEDGLFPHENSIYEPSGLEEERRLMYVAITRARKRLYLSLAQSRMLHGQTRYSIRSRFLEEVPEAHAKWLSPRAKQAWADQPMLNSMTAANKAISSLTTGLEIAGVRFRVGQGVRHPRFGDGTILSLSGLGLDAQAQIHFLDVGTKTLALGIAKLDIIEG